MAVGYGPTNRANLLPVVLLESVEPERVYFLYPLPQPAREKLCWKPTRAALLFLLGYYGNRQVRIREHIEKVDVTLSEKYFSTDLMKGRLSAIVPIKVKKFQTADAWRQVGGGRSTGSVRKTWNWGGYALKSSYFEFWARPRKPPCTTG